MADSVTLVEQGGERPFMLCPVEPDDELQTIGRLLAAAGHLIAGARGAAEITMTCLARSA